MKRPVLAALIVLATVIGCARPPAPKGILVYKGLSEQLPRLDPGILGGRRVLIDPGHGGHFMGTLGQEGLQEARVNLGVSLYLWGLLREAGAEVHLTRSAERDFLTPADSSLAGELGVRVAIVDSLRPDILVSIHHNAQNDRDPRKNAVETYYRFGDPASRDLAFAVHRHLIRNLGIESGEVRPGNYFILRNIDIPAILGEGSYLTHPEVEASLQLSEKQRLEAEAYFLGILEYFSRGVPKVERLAPLDSAFVAVPTLSFAIDDVGGLGIDPGGVDVTVNGETVEAFLAGNGRTVRYQLPWDSPNAEYELSLQVRNLLGNSSSVHRFGFVIDLPPEIATFDNAPLALPASGGTVRVRARLLDRRGRPVIDGSTIRLHASRGVTPDSVVVEDGFAEFPLSIDAVTVPVRLTLTSHGRSFELEVPPARRPTTALRKVVIVDARTAEGIKRARVTFGDTLLVNGSNSGVYFLPADVVPRFGRPESPEAWVEAPGYRPRPAESLNSATDTLALSPWYDGSLLGRRFMIDPEGGFDPAAGMGALGLSGPFVNLQVARYLEEYLEAAGAEVELTRRNEETLSPRDVVAVTNRFRADRYVEIRHRNAPADSGLVVHCHFFPGSRAGLGMSETVQRALSGYLGLPARAPSETVTFPLQQTACPAIVVALPSIAVVDEELRLGEPGYQRKQAYGMFLGILEHFGAVPGASAEVTVIDSLRSNWLITLDRTWSLLSDDEGRAVFPFLPPGRYPVWIRRGDVSMDAGSLDVEAGGHRRYQISDLPGR
ncbi:MAG: N-acetylmuramoyl-L-alanine amidase [Candidatus Krumholzibacteriia bacterium]